MLSTLTTRRFLTVVAGLALLVATPARAFDVQAGIRFLAVTDAPVGAQLILYDHKGDELERKLADSYGSVIFRELDQGATYTIRDASEPPSSATEVTVLKFEDHPDPSFYSSQVLTAGYQYIEARDGTLLAAMVRPPAGKTMADGPFPTVVEYSGYTVADPDNPQPSTLIASVLGYATVGVNMRGSGCSGGVLDLFDLPTTADGYDVVETVAAQSWVQGGKVGMVGISFPGISQLFIAGAEPPHLEAIAPFSTIADIYRSPGFPGGIFNNGFAESWLQDRRHDAEPAPSGGQAWAINRVNNGDTVCEQNQHLRLQTEDPVDFTIAYPYYRADLMAARSPINWVSDIRVPMFYAGAWQDEQVGGDFASMLRYMPRKKDVKITLLNGVHSSPLEPEILYNWISFLDLYVAHVVPDPGRAAPLAGLLYSQILGAGTPTPPLPDDVYDGITDYDEALALFESAPFVRVLFDNGAGSATPGLPAPGFEMGFSKWPPRKARKRVWYFGPDGLLAPKRIALSSQGFDTYAPDPESRPMQTLPGQGESQSWEIMPDYDWRPLVDGTAVAYITDPLDEDTIVVGPGSVDLWLRSSDVDTDVQVTLTEVRPDGLETYVQNGWLRATHRKIMHSRGSRLEPRPTHLATDAQLMPAGEFAKVRVGLFAVGHAFRAGSRIRISVEAPGGDRTRWSFDTYLTGGTVLNDVDRERRHASRLLLPVVRRATIPTPLPPCPGLRGQPCRSYVPAVNGG